MAKKLTEKRAQELKKQGVQYIASICKSVYNTEYFKIASIDAIMLHGGRMPKYYRGVNGYIVGRIGSSIDWKRTIRWSMI